MSNRKFFPGGTFKSYSDRIEVIKKFAKQYPNAAKNMLDAQESGEVLREVYSFLHSVDERDLRVCYNGRRVI
jgi:hypothetical protein